MPPAVKGLPFTSLTSSALGVTCLRAASLPVADTVFVNGVIHTMDKQSTTFTAGSLTITNGTITCVVQESDCKAVVGSITKVVDFNGKAMIPGLVDAS